MDSRSLPLALTIGEPSGIGAEILLSAWLARSELRLSPFYALADPALLRACAARLGWSVAISETEPAGALRLFSKTLPVVPLQSTLEDSPGRPLSANAPGVIEAITRGVDQVMKGDAAAVITNPIAKKTLYEAGFSFPGHTEFLGDLAQKATGIPATPVMMLAGPELRTVPVTVHVPLAEVPARLNADLITGTGRIVAGDLKRRFGIGRPRLAIAGLNPHAGEGGAMGREDAAVVAPAVEVLKSEGIDVAGPLPADTMFHPAARAKYDAALCMYHDQALIPVKTLAFDETVNVTLGLPFVRTSPDHGTAFDIAGKGIARRDSLIAALRMARHLADNAAAFALA